jgi:hypothetical protein
MSNSYTSISNIGLVMKDKITLIDGDSNRVRTKTFLWPALVRGIE